MTRWLCLVVLAAACGHSPPKKDPVGGGSGSATPVADDPTCPLVVPGTSVTFEDTENGPAFVFVTTGDVVAVRTRSAALVDMHNRHDGPKSALGMMFSATAKASATDVDGGSRVVFSGGDASVGESLRMHVKMFAGATTCEMKM